MIQKIIRRGVPPSVYIFLLLIFCCIHSQAQRIIHLMEERASLGNAHYESWRTLNPDYTVKLWRENDRLKLISSSNSDIREAFLKLTPYEKEFFLSYLIVYTHGGVYSRAGSRCIESISNWIDDSQSHKVDFFAGISADVKPEEKNAFGRSRLREVSTKTFGGKPFNDCLKCVINKIVNRIMYEEILTLRPWSEADSRELTGGGVFTDCVFEVGNFQFTRVVNSSWIANNGIMLFGSNAFSFDIDSLQSVLHVPGLKSSISPINGVSRELNEYIATNRVFVYHEKDYMSLRSDVFFSRKLYLDGAPVVAMHVSDEWMEARGLSRDLKLSFAIIEFVSHPLLWRIGWHIALWFLFCFHIVHSASMSLLFASCLLIIHTLEFSAYVSSMIIIFISCLSSLLTHSHDFDKILITKSIRALNIMCMRKNITSNVLGRVKFAVGFLLLCLCALVVHNFINDDMIQALHGECNCYECTFPLTVDNIVERKNFTTFYHGGYIGENAAAFKAGTIHDVGIYVREIMLLFENTGSNIWLPELDYRVGAVGNVLPFSQFPIRLALPQKTLPGELAIIKFAVDMSEFCKQGSRHIDVKWRLLIEFVSWFGDESHEFRLSCNRRRSFVNVANAGSPPYIFSFSLALLAIQSIVLAHLCRRIILGARVHYYSSRWIRTGFTAMTLISVIAHRSLYARALAVTRLAVQSSSFFMVRAKYFEGITALLFSLVAGEAMKEFDVRAEYLFREFCPLNGHNISQVIEVEAIHETEEGQFNATFIRLEAVKTAHPGQSIRFHILLENSGERPWIESDNIYLVPVHFSKGLALQVPSRLELPVPIVPHKEKAPFTFDTTLDPTCVRGEQYFSQYRMAIFRPGKIDPDFFGSLSEIHKIVCSPDMDANFEFIDIRSGERQVHSWARTNEPKQNDIRVKTRSGLRVLITMHIRNTGTIAWKKESGISLGMKCCAMNDKNNIKIERTYMLRNAIFPGETSEFFPEIPLECTSGVTVAYQWQMFQENVEWFGTLSPWIYVDCVHPRHDAVVRVASTFPPYVDASSATAHKAQLLVINSGQSVWESGSVNLGMKGELGEKLKVYDIPSSVFPVEPLSNILVDIDLNFPLSKCGGREHIALAWQMLDEYGAWIGLGTTYVPIFCTISCSTSPKTISGSFFMTYHRDILDKIKDTASMMPRIIHQSWKVRHCTYEQSRVVASWLRYHPDWIHVLWTDDELDTLVMTFRKDLAQVYFDFPKDIYRLDMSRYILMHEFGGIYADLDVEAVKSLEPLRFTTNAFVGTESDAHSLFLYGKNRTICNAIIGSRPKHPFWNYFIAQISAMNYEKSLNTDPVYVTGPQALGDALDSYYETARAPVDHVNIFPDYYFMPHIASYRRDQFKNLCYLMRISFNNQTNEYCSKMEAANWMGVEISNETFSIHHWKCTWCN